MFNNIYIYIRYIKKKFYNNSNNLFLQISRKLKSSDDNMQNGWKKLIFAISKSLF